MAGFAGVVVLNDDADLPFDKEQICNALRVRGQRQVHFRGSRGALFAELISSPPARQTGGDQSAPQDSLFLADARFDNRAELGDALGIAPTESALLSDSTLLELMYRRWGEDGVARCLGAFAFARWNAAERRLILGRDYLGDRSLFFHRGRGFVAFASAIRTLLALPLVPRQIDELVLADLLALDFSETWRTLYSGIERVPTRTIVSLGAAGLRSSVYWSPNLDATPPYKREQDYVERARELFDQAVAATISDLPRVAIATSGGLDSSAVAATVARLGRTESIDCYTLVPPEGFQLDIGRFSYLNEREKVEALARMYPQLNVRFFAPEKAHADIADETRFFARGALPLFALANLAAFGHIYDAIRAAGHRVLLVGTMGNYGLSWNGRFSLLALLRHGQWLAFGRDLLTISRRLDRSPIRVLLSEVVMPAMSRDSRFWIRRLRGRDPNDVSGRGALNPAFIAEHDLPSRWREHGFDPTNVGDGWRPERYRAHQFYSFSQIGRDFRAQYRENAGLEVRDPHADRRLLEFLLSVPEPMYRRDGVHRSLARAVLADRLPSEIVTETRIGMQGVTWFRDLSAKRVEIAGEIERLEASPMASRLLDLPRLKRLVQNWPADAQEAERHRKEYRLTLWRGVHVGRFIRWVEGGNS